MITITKFEISPDRLKISVGITLSAGFVVNSLKLWTQSTYKIASQAIDILPLANGATNVEVFDINASDVSGLSEFDGIYFMEVDSSDPTDIPGIVGTTSLTKHYSTIAALTSSLDASCLNCNPNFQNAILMDLYVEGVKDAILLGRFRDAIEFYNRMSLIDTSQCNECNKINPVVSTAGNLVSIGVVDCLLNI